MVSGMTLAFCRTQLQENICGRYLKNMDERAWKKNIFKKILRAVQKLLEELVVVRGISNQFVLSGAMPLKIAQKL
jgi:hypothetical protein